MTFWFHKSSQNFSDQFLKALNILFPSVDFLLGSWVSFFFFSQIFLFSLSLSKKKKKIPQVVQFLGSLTAEIIYHIKNPNQSSDTSLVKYSQAIQWTLKVENTSLPIRGNWQRLNRLWSSGVESHITSLSKLDIFPQIMGNKRAIFWPCCAYGNLLDICGNFAWKTDHWMLLLFLFFY